MNTSIDHVYQLAVESGYELMSDQTVHELKVWPEFYKALDSRTKEFEVRKNDRNYRVGDVLWLREFDPDKAFIPANIDGSFCYTGRYMYREITYILTGGQFGIEPEYVVMNLADVD